MKRSSGILLHISSLPSSFGIGDLGPVAYEYADFLAAAKQSYWQILPLNPPTLRRDSYSPYDCLSAFAGNTLSVSPELLYQNGLLDKADIRPAAEFPKDRVCYKKVIPYKAKLLNKAYENFRSRSKPQDFGKFVTNNKDWLENFLIFAALRKKFGPRLWCGWPFNLRERGGETIISAKAELHDEIERERFAQYTLFTQWHSLKLYCNRRGIRFIGDIPFYVAYDSSDVWAHPEIFKLSRAKKPECLAGVPPDYFSSTGQMWGNPVYNWRALKKDNYSWWKRRIGHNLKMFDLVRIDHFRGFVASWQIPAGAAIAAEGRWVTGPGRHFFETCFEKRSVLKRIIAEDLGRITPAVRRLMERFHLRGMRVLLFAFDGNSRSNPHYPCNHVRDSVVYTGTHDTNTVRGWFDQEAGIEQKAGLCECLGQEITPAAAPGELVRLAVNSVADLVIVPMQDVLGLGAGARMNHPGTTKNNWTWRLRSDQIIPDKVQELSNLTECSGRS